MRLNPELVAKCEALAAPAAAHRPGLDAGPLTVVVRVETPNPLNGSHGNYYATAARAKRQLKATLDALGIARLEGRADPARFADGCVVSMRRVCPGRGLASDALPGALKHIRDGVAQWLLGGKPGERDDDPAITWEPPTQGRLGKAKGVVVCIRRRD